MQVAAAIWQEPTVLVIDEPTNHLDIVSKQYLFDLMQLFKGTGLLVSHDRKFMDELCQSCVRAVSEFNLLQRWLYIKSRAEK